MLQNSCTARSPSYLRFSVTEACNFRCQYCLPKGCPTEKSADSSMSTTEIRTLFAAMAEVGIQKVRVTGGEPGLRSDLVEIVAIAANTPGILWTSLTTNGTALFPAGGKNSCERARILANAGLKSLNISLDSLNGSTFRTITGRDCHQEVLDAIEAALATDGLSVKINCVLVRDCNDGELDTWLAFVRQRRVTVRFIELMPTRGSENIYSNSYVSALPIVQRLVEDGWQERNRDFLDGPAREFTHPDFAGRMGVITPVSDCFCAACNRVRVTADGRLHLCVFQGEGVPIRHWLAPGFPKDELMGRLKEHLLGKCQVSVEQTPMKRPFSQNFARMGG